VYTLIEEGLPLTHGEVLVKFKKVVYNIVGGIQNMGITNHDVNHILTHRPKHERKQIQ
jgi:hypothetical protein